VIPKRLLGSVFGAAGAAAAGPLQQYLPESHLVKGAVSSYLCVCSLTLLTQLRFAMQQIGLAASSQEVKTVVVVLLLSTVVSSPLHLARHVPPYAQFVFPAALKPHFAVVEGISGSNAQHVPGFAGSKSPQVPVTITEASDRILQLFPAGVTGVGVGFFTAVSGVASLPSGPWYFPVLAS